MQRTAPILWAAIDCKNTRSHCLMRLRFLQPMQPHNLSTFHKSAIALATADPQ